jgi:peroxiredoxin
MRNFQARLAEFEKVNAQVLGVSVDSYASQGKFQDEVCPDIPLLSDFPKNATSIAYGTLNEERGTDKRITVVIDRNRVVRLVYEDTQSMEAHAEEALKVLQELT